MQKKKKRKEKKKKGREREREGKREGAERTSGKWLISLLIQLPPVRVGWCAQIGYRQP